MTQVLYAVLVGLTLAVFVCLIGVPDWAAPLSYAIGMTLTLLVRGSARGVSARLARFR